MGRHPACIGAINNKEQSAAMFGSVNNLAAMEVRWQRDRLVWISKQKIVELGRDPSDKMLHRRRERKEKCFCLFFLSCSVLQKKEDGVSTAKEEWSNIPIPNVPVTLNSQSKRGAETSLKQFHIWLSQVMPRKERKRAQFVLDSEQTELNCW